MPKAKKLAISSLAAAVIADPLIFGPRRSLEDAIAQLRMLPAIDEWSAQYIAMRELREPDAFPPAEPGLLCAIPTVGGGQLSAAEFLAHAERWRPWRAYAALHLWATELNAFPTHERVRHDHQVA